MRLALASLLMMTACQAASEQPLDEALLLRAVPHGDSLHLTLVPSAGIRINAGAPPAIELPSGAVVRLAGARAAADSDYFAAPPTGTVDSDARGLQVTVRAVTCADGERVCRPHEAVITLP